MCGNILLSSITKSAIKVACYRVALLNCLDNLTHLLLHLRKIKSNSRMFILLKFYSLQYNNNDIALSHCLSFLIERNTPQTMALVL